MIKQPTCITKDTRSTTDLFLTNYPHKFSHSGVSDLGISDHSLVYAIRKISVPKSSPKIKTSRCFKNYDSVSFRNDLSMAPWHLVEAESDPNKAWDIWKQIFICLADSRAPLKKTKVRGISASWITPELKHDMFERNRLKKVASQSQSDAD